MNRSTVLRRILPLAVLLAVGAAGRAAAQNAALAEELAPLLAAEDARRFDQALFARSVGAADPVVRRTAAMSIGRIGDLRGTALLIPMLADRDSSVMTTAAFALGLLRDTAAIAPLIEHLSNPPALPAPATLEAITALSRIGGARVGEWFAGVLEHRVQLVVPDTGLVVREIVLQSFRLKRDAPVAALLPFLDDTTPTVRQRAVYTLGSVRAVEAAPRIAARLTDEDPTVRATAARALTSAYADSAHQSPSTVAGLLAHAIDDQDPAVRINALRSLGTFHDSTHVNAVLPHLNDTFDHVRLQAVMTLGELGGASASKALQDVLTRKLPIGLLREALTGLARIDTAAFRQVATGWAQDADWRERAAAAEGWALAGAVGTPWFLNDRDGRVIAAGLQAWAGQVEGADPQLVAAARRLLSSRDAAVRSVSADIIGRAADPADIPALADAYRRTTSDSFADAALSAVAAAARISASGQDGRLAAERGFLAVIGRPDNYLIRAWAERNWPAASRRWGPAYPIQTGRTLQDYRDLAQTYILTPPPASRPHVTIETDQRGTIEIELLGSDAPLTVANFLRLVDRRFFDGNRWHRVVPDFVIQDGDPRGDGWGGPGGAIRDEINRHRYNKPVLGMALSGPDTGASQWFINLSPQPHLDGVYTIFGRVVAGQGTLLRIMPGDYIRSIHR
ncbi:MAG TPA: HEAT repeat domain-containing protein [Gemmatimonadales bacterium]|nr:HEAT repeat domain-containing protein [Gemmatimonadales bacterium]